MENSFFLSHTNTLNSSPPFFKEGKGVVEVLGGGLKTSLLQPFVAFSKLRRKEGTSIPNAINLVVTTNI